MMHRGRPNYIGTLKFHNVTNLVTVLINGPFHSPLYRFGKRNTIITMNLTQHILNKGTVQIRGILRGRPKNIGTLKYKLMTLNTITLVRKELLSHTVSFNKTALINTIHPNTKCLIIASKENSSDPDLQHQETKISETILKNHNCSEINLQIIQC